MRLWHVCLPFCCAVLLSVLATAEELRQYEHTWQQVELPGLYEFGHATNTIMPCGSGQPIWLDGAGQASADLHDAYDVSVAEHLDPLFVIVRGKLDADYDSGDYWRGWFVIEELVDFSADPAVIAACEGEAGRPYLD